MKLLVLDTSTEWCSTALWLDGAVHARRELAEQRHSSLILPMVDALLKEADITLRALDGIGYGAGPGSFTGLRIACAVTQGLAFGADLPVVGISTLESLAAQTDAKRVLTLLDARMAEVYWAAYDRDGEDWRAVVEPRLALPDSVFVPDGADWVGAGNGFAVLDAGLRADITAKLLRLGATLMPDAAAMAPLAARAFARDEGRDAAEAAPIYLRDKVALTVEERRARKSP
ncbi:MAG: tRNA (adenosine(37)-N6)-threonylcarbamoyltransferase complex dimerization subunit type 1 TsaB [Hydrogenophilales bacterium 16-64-46]|nr:MAG: tRNA (adenosine(37)-N6)-threonylcarbamoyltransferase complex dimerization subunit type 1 TsaB [Hydrogenophilales bacterium 12-64-13]OYZ06383.1 MAG: tRNA (adenosine(37)-N6)-threonylcarbamoyltransferase complex dimerization subunit type 1 TsaB [Hydrogenophilales bacterium 16-64-46]OZA36591.1 MAG: tRNA (adenosine(37)-N6)-threonylcarbamoyltransferase complex dimerization subunit type 1 TsaB [Hydrogenophilales bacterium 17-64-34]HQT01383.1 tRNA (adenosine(37)-N6)-threonylcarbamoyltransferase 